MQRMEYTHKKGIGKSVDSAEFTHLETKSVRESGRQNKNAEYFIKQEQVGVHYDRNYVQQGGERKIN